MWRSRAEYVWRVVYYWVQCVIVRVTWGARSVHSAAPTSAYKEREDLIYVVERPDRMGSLYSVGELRGSLYLVVLPDILYAFIYLINGRLEAYGINSVLCKCVLLKSSHHTCEYLHEHLCIDGQLYNKPYQSCRTIHIHRCVQVCMHSDM